MSASFGFAVGGTRLFFSGRFSRIMEQDVCAFCTHCFLASLVLRDSSPQTCQPMSKGEVRNLPFTIFDSFPVILRTMTTIGTKRQPLDRLEKHCPARPSHALTGGERACFGSGMMAANYSHPHGGSRRCLRAARRPGVTRCLVGKILLHPALSPAGLVCLKPSRLCEGRWIDRCARWPGWAPIGFLFSRSLDKEVLSCSDSVEL